MSDTPEKFPDSTPTPLSDPRAHIPPTDMDYELIRLIGRGGYGEVWLVRDKSGNYRACKVVYRESFQNDRPYEREYEGICKFEPVSRAAENQIKILHVGRRDAAGYFYYIMELADDTEGGQTIHPDHYVPKTLASEIKRKKKLSANECIQIGLSLSAALENLHRHGLIHRDIKPGNIIFVNGVPKLADIGLVTDMDVTISYVGTDGFIPPEGPTSPRADIYGLGKVLYEISTGKDRLEYPELPENFAEFSDWGKMLELNAIITKACEADASRRYQSTSELHAELELLAAGKSVRQRRSSKRKWIFAVRAATILAAMGLIAGGIIYFSKYQSQHEQIKIISAKIPLPDAAQLAQSESKIKDACHAQLTGGTTAAKQQAAAELLNRSSAETNPAMKLALLRVAAQLAIQAADFSRAMEICDKMNDRFQMDILPVKADLLSQAAIYARTTRNKADLADICVAVGFQAIAGDDYVSAKKIDALAKSNAKNSADTHLSGEANFLGDETARCADAFERVKPFAATLRENPNNPAASLAMGKFLCFAKNDWAAGLQLLARGDDEALKAIASKELNNELKTAPEQIALGSSWWDLATDAPDDEKEFYQQRARHWYLKGIAGSSELDKNRLKPELTERIKSMPTQFAEVHIVSRVGGTEFVDIYSDEVQWRSSRRGTVGNKINQVNLGNFSASDLEIIKNNGVTRLMPDAVDFSTARLNMDRKPGHGGHADLQIFEDHVRVALAHPKAGAATLEVTVTFGNQP
ncbi:MAG TPA: serine/threonine-protein kinase [Verrucomicrobiae bacterium]|jgi:serine/threonine protein kinase|nr:serine/threonine-protein kinase [Verrucomicrobiae bacterium]